MDGLTMAVLVFAAQVFVVWWAINWLAHRGETDAQSFRRTCHQIGRCATWPARARRARRARLQAADLDEWHRKITWWVSLRGQHAPGTRQFEAANDMVAYLQATRPGPCPNTGFYCDRPHCSTHPRSHP